MKIILFVILYMMVNSSSCVHSTGYSPAKQLLIAKGDNTSAEIRLIEGTVLVKENYYELNFKTVKEGSSYFFGRKINGVVADDETRVEILRGNELVVKYSINLKVR